MDNINLESLNKNGKNLQVNVQIVTLEDNLTHPYFSLVDLSEDNVHPLGVATVEMPYEPQISNYWIKYSGSVVISFNIADYQYQNTNTEEYLKKFSLKNRVINEQYNYSLICKISRFKQKGNKFIIYFENLGWKFLQKVPKEFRDSFIAGQSLDDAFQAICEFLDVQFAYSIEDLHEYSFASNGYSIEKEGQVVEDVETVLSRWGQVKDEPKIDEEETEEGTDENSTTNTTMNQPTTEQKNQNDKSIASDATNTTDETENPTEEEQTDNIQEKIDKYQEEFEEKILDLFRGNTYYESNLTSNVMNYDSITITPKAPETDTSNMSSVGGDSSSENSSTDAGAQFSQNLLNQGRTGITLSGVQLQPTGKIALSYDQVNSMSFAQAKQEAQKTSKYYYTTILRLRARAALYNVSASTPYSRFA